MGEHIGAIELEAIAFRVMETNKKVGDLLPAEQIEHALGCEACRASIMVYDGVAEAERFKLSPTEPVGAVNFDDARYQRF